MRKLLENVVAYTVTVTTNVCDWMMAKTFGDRYKPLSHEPDMEADQEPDEQVRKLKKDSNALHGIIFALLYTAKAQKVKLPLDAFYHASGATINWQKLDEEWMSVEIVPRQS